MARATRRVMIEGSDRELASTIEEASGLWGSFMGLMFRRGMPTGHGMIFRPARGIHTSFMFFDLDLIYLDKHDIVTKIRPKMVPWRIDVTSAAGCLELNAGVAARAGLEQGDRLLFSPSAP